MELTASTSNSTDERNAKKGDLILSFNELQNKLIASGHSLDIPLPRILVIGCQSAGKSSVLERFVKKEFLPRGANLVTRCPIIIQLVPSTTEEYGIFGHREDKYTDFSAICDEIKRVTEEECKPQEFSKKPISLTIYSPHVLKLTVVDLPGIIKVPTGTQTKETVQMSDEIVKEYIKDPKSIILAVTPVCQDISNSDALQYASTVDPEGERTIGVLTKIDMIEEGTDARDILENSLVPLKRGWVGVINRSTKETVEGKDMEYILKKESDFFKNNKLYSHMAHRMGVPYLQRHLHKTLKTHILQCLPELRRDISQKLFKLEKELQNYDKIIEGGSVKQMYMVDLIQKFCEDITVKILGYSEKVPTNTLTYGALMNFKLHKEVQRIISQVILPDENEILHHIPNINGLRNSISVPSLVVDSTCKSLIERFKGPLYESVDCIKQVLLDAIEESAEILSSFPTLKKELLYQIQSWVEKESEETKDRFKNHIEAEMFFINTCHPDFDSSTCDKIAPPTGPVKVWTKQKDKRDKTASNDEDEDENSDTDESADADNEVLYLLLLQLSLCIAPSTGPVKVWTKQEDKRDKTASNDEDEDENSDTDESADADNEVTYLLNLLKANPVMQKQVKYVTELVVKYLKIVRIQISDIAVKYIAYFVVQKVLYSINHDLIKVVFDSTKISSLSEDSTEDIEKREEIKMSCKNLREALDAIRSF